MKLPNVLNKEDELAILQAASHNQKHRTMLSLIYACGLRRGELLNLRPENVDSKRHLLIILNAKGQKDRVIPISYLYTGYDTRMLLIYWKQAPILDIYKNC